jgi:hypothetical protein
MKRCSTCQRTYPDDAPDYCTADGTRLVKEEAEAYDPQKTMLASAPPPPQQYSNPQPAPPPPAPPQGIPQPAPPPQAGWPPSPQQQQQGQNWGGGYYPGQAYAPPTTKSNGLSLIALILGVLSGLMATLLLLEERGIMRTVGGRDSAFMVTLGAAITGIAAIIIGIIALISKRQRSKVLAIVGMVLAAYSIIFWIYLEAEYGVVFR